MISFACPSCERTIKVKDELAGKKGKCPGCGQPVAVPASGARVPAAVSQPARVAPTLGTQSRSGLDAATLPPSGDGERAADASGAETVSGGRLQAASKHAAELTEFLAPPQAPDEIGRLGMYRVLAVLGQGGMGVVFKAEDPGLQRLVALKAMLPALASKEANTTRFLREARAAAAVKNDHIVQIYQVGEDHGAPYLAMEFLEGEPLDARLKRDPELSIGEIMRIGRETALGLAAAHARGLIHRDIKPGNLWLETPHAAHSPGVKRGGGEGGRVKILDFGLARALGDETHLTQSGAIIGTPAYMAPEQAGGRDVDQRCDLFSLGSVLYQMCAGELPFKGQNTLAILSALALETPRPPRTVKKAVPKALSDLIMQLLAKNPEDRPPSAQAVVGALSSMERQLATMTNVVPTRKQPAEIQEKQDTRRQKKGAPRTETHTRKLEPAKISRRHLMIAGLAAAALLLFGSAIVLFWQTPTGLVRVEIDDPEIKVAIDKGQFTIQGADKHDIKLTAGDHQLRIKRGDFEFEADKFVLKKGDKVKLRIEFLAGKVQVVQDGKVTSVKELPATKEEAGFQPLFNGKDLTGWKLAKAGPNWSVKDGILLAKGPGSGHLFTDRGNFTDVHVRVEARINAVGNSGVFVRAPYKDGWPWGYEAQINAAQSDLKTGGIYVSLAKSVQPSRPAPPAGEWFTLEVIARGNATTVLVNGQKTAEYIDPKNEYPQGHIALQKHDPNTVVEFRKVEVKELKSENPPQPEFTRLFNGKDLTGWETVGDGQWTVKDGLLRSLPGKTMGWLATDKDYGDFDLELEYRLGERGNTGVFVHAWKEGALNGGQFLEVQLIDDVWHNTVGKVNGTGAIFGVLAPKPTVKSIPDKWHKAAISSRGRRLKVVFDGQPVIDANLDDYPGSFQRFPGLLKSTGRIGLQHYGTQVDFRNIRLRP